jgi:hypothetical protein
MTPQLHRLQTARGKKKENAKITEICPEVTLRKWTVVDAKRHFRGDI